MDAETTSARKTLRALLADFDHVLASEYEALRARDTDGLENAVARKQELVGAIATAGERCPVPPPGAAGDPEGDPEASAEWAEIRQLLARCALANRTNGRKLMYLAGVDHARFKRTVVPGDVLELRVQILQERRKLGKARGEAWVDDKMVAEAEILFADAEA